MNENGNNGVIKTINTYKIVIVAMITIAVAWGALNFRVSASGKDIDGLEAKVLQVPINKTNIENIKEDIRDLKDGQEDILDAISELK